MLCLNHLWIEHALYGLDGEWFDTLGRNNIIQHILNGIFHTKPLIIHSFGACQSSSFIGILWKTKFLLPDNTIYAKE